MEPTQVWIVSQSSGSYEDFREWPVGAFPTKEEAEEWIDINQPIFQQDLDKQTQEGQEYREKWDELVRTYSHPWDDTTSDNSLAFDREFKAFLQIWEGKATSEPYEHWGYSLVDEPIPFYSHGQ